MHKRLRPIGGRRFLVTSRFEKVGASSEQIDPTLGIRQSAVLNAGQDVIELLGPGPGSYTVADLDGLSAIGKLPDRRDHYGRADAEGFGQTAAFDAAAYLVHRQGPLANSQSEFPGEG